MKDPFRSLAGAAVALTICVLVAHAWSSLSRGFDVNLVSGVWLALAQDLRDGIFYRDLIGPSGYGGTRYFPLFFALIAALMAIGLDPISAGHAASAIGAGMLVSGAYALLRRLGVRRDAAIPITVLATAAPYFIQQTAYAIRVEPLAGGLALWGLAAVAGAMQQYGRSWSRMAIPAACFTLAIAAKPTSAYAPAAAVVALAVGRRWADVSRLGGLTAAGLLLLVAGIQGLSGGRFVEGLQATALAGQSVGGLFSPDLVTRPIALIATSRMLTVMFLLAAAALIASPARWRELPAVVLVAAALATALALATPGTILTNQIVELYVAAVLFLGWLYYTSAYTTRLGTMAVALLLIWAAAQNGMRTAAIRGQAEAESLAGSRAALITAVRSCGGALLSESPLIPIVAGRSPILLDPFAFRVVALRRPLAEDLIARLSRREFACVVLEQNPEDARGAGWYRNVHFGWPVIEAVLRHYEYRETVAGHRFYKAYP